MSCLSCDAEVDGSRLFCTFHWSLVPKNVKLIVWEAYELGYPKGSEPWIRAVGAAIRAIREQDLRPASR